VIEENKVILEILVQMVFRGLKGLLVFKVIEDLMDLLDQLESKVQEALLDLAVPMVMMARQDPREMMVPQVLLV
jgi:hypothetical protein